MSEWDEKKMVEYARSGRKVHVFSWALSLLAPPFAPKYQYHASLPSPPLSAFLSCSQFCTYTFRLPPFHTAMFPWLSVSEKIIFAHRTSRGTSGLHASSLELSNAARCRDQPVKKSVALVHFARLIFLLKDTLSIRAPWLWIRSYEILFAFTFFRTFIFYFIPKKVEIRKNPEKCWKTSKNSRREYNNRKKLTWSKFGVIWRNFVRFFVNRIKVTDKIDQEEKCVGYVKGKISSKGWDKKYEKRCRCSDGPSDSSRLTPRALF